RQDQTLEHAYNTLAARHRSAMASLCSDPPDDRATGIIDEQLTELHDALRGIRLVGHCPPAALDVVASFGERLSALIVAAHLNRFRRARFVDARRFVTTDEQFTRANVMFEKTDRAARRYFTSFWSECDRQIPVVTGFIGSTTDGRTTTIGRNGADYTAAISGAAIGGPGTAGRLFQALTSGGVNALLTSQPLGEHTISFAVRNDEAGAAVQAVTQEFRFEFQRGLTALDQKANQAIVAVIGNGVKE